MTLLGRKATFDGVTYSANDKGEIVKLNKRGEWVYHSTFLSANDAMGEILKWIEQGYKS